MLSRAHVRPVLGSTSMPAVRGFLDPHAVGLAWHRSRKNSTWRPAHGSIVIALALGDPAPEAAISFLSFPVPPRSASAQAASVACLAEGCPAIPLEHRAGPAHLTEASSWSAVVDDRPACGPRHQPERAPALVQHVRRLRGRRARAPVELRTNVRSRRGPRPPPCPQLRRCSSVPAVNRSLPASTKSPIFGTARSNPWLWSFSSPSHQSSTRFARLA